VEGEFEQRVQPVSARGREELAGFVGGEGFEASGPWGAGADVAGDVAGDLFLQDGVLQGGLEDGVEVGERQRGEQLVAALAGGAAAGLVAPGVNAARAALAGGAELVEPGADVLGGELGQLLLAEAGDEVPVDVGGGSTRGAARVVSATATTSSRPTKCRRFSAPSLPTSPDR
jgi:hypothetical protein